MYDPGPALEAIRDMPFSIEGRNIVDSEGNATICWPEGGNPHRLIFGRSRRTNLPQQEHGGVRRALPIPPGAGLSEVSHAVWFPNNYVGAEFNFYGPRFGSFHSYLTNKVDHLYAGCGFDLLLLNRGIEELKRLDGLRVFTLKVNRSYASVVAKASTSLADALDAQMSVVDADEIEVVLKVTQKHKTMTKAFFDGVLNLAGITGLPQQLEKLTVRGPNALTGAVEEVDLLRDELIVAKPMARIDPRSNAVRSESAFDQIVQAYDEVKDLLGQAQGLTQ